MIHYVIIDKFGNYLTPSREEYVKKYRDDEAWSDVCLCNEEAMALTIASLLMARDIVELVESGVKNED